MKQDASGPASDDSQKKHKQEQKHHAHAHTHAHTHAHAHAHAQNATTYDKAFLISIVANGLFVIAQIIGALMAHSSSLLADAIHNLGDVLGLILAWMATKLIERKPTEKTTYGLKKTSILAALTNGILLVFTCGIIAAQAVYKLFSPSPIETVFVIIIASVGIIINGATALLFLRGSEDLNIRGAYLHLFYDALISVGVVISAALMYWSNWLWIDPVVGLLIAFIILKGTWVLFANSFRLIIDGVPDHISWSAVSHFFATRPGVEGVHDLHIWAISTQENALSVHLFIPNEEFTDEARGQLVLQIKEQFGIQHTTIQIEKTNTDCNDACHHG